MNDQTQEVVKSISELAPTALTKDPRVKNKFVDIFNTVHGKKNGNMVYETESFHFQKAIVENQNLQGCTPLSLYGCFIDVAVQGLSFDPTKKLAYMVPYSVNIGTQENKKWEKRANLQISPYGELALRQECGQIKRADNPVMVFEGEPFELFSSDSGKMVRHTIKYPRPEKPIACYIKLVKPDDNIDYFVLDLPGMMRLAEFSKKKNNGKSNALYTSGPAGLPDIGFWQAKTIKHAFQAYPKIRLKGAHTVLESDTEEQEEYQVDYSLEESSSTQRYIEPLQEQRQNPIKPTEATVIMTTSETEESDITNQASTNQPGDTEEGF